MDHTVVEAEKSHRKPRSAAGILQSKSKHLELTPGGVNGANFRRNAEKD